MNQQQRQRLAEFNAKVREGRTPAFEAGYADGLNGVARNDDSMMTDNQRREYRRGHKCGVAIAKERDAMGGTTMRYNYVTPIPRR